MTYLFRKNKKIKLFLNQFYNFLIKRSTFLFNFFKINFRNFRSFIFNNFKNFSTLTSPRKAFTLVEVLVALVIFTTIILAVSRIYIGILRSQEGVGAQNYVQSDLEYFMRFSSNNLRLAEISKSNLCSIPDGHFFLVEDEGRSITFIKDGQCQQFYLEKEGDLGTIKASFDDNTYDQALNSSQTNILDLFFVVEDYLSTGQPLVTLLVKASSLEDSLDITYLQTSVSLAY